MTEYNVIVSSISGLGGFTVDAPDQRSASKKAKALIRPEVKILKVVRKTQPVHELLEALRKERTLDQFRQDMR